ncbi:MAG: antirestriction protein ArdA [Emticicia sp.]|nr:antirestriction protein ArdA [Emticicia sp.]
MQNSNVPAIYVGTYYKYNCGSIAGKWLDLTEYSSKDEFYEACRELHSDEEDAEFMFQDWENIPDFLISECSLSDDAFEYFEALESMDDDKAEALKVYRENVLGSSYEISVSDLIEQFEDAYQGYYSGNAEINFTYEYVEQAGFLDNCPNELSIYFDYEAYARDLFSSSFVEYDGYVFSN